MADDLPLEHVERSRLPWRADGMTECGLPFAGHPVITRDEFIAKIKRLGKQRTSMTTCMTCWSTADRWEPWDQDPVACIQRETYGTRMFRTAGHPEHDRFRDELVALAELVGRHRDEFDTILSSLGDTVRLDDARQQRRRRHG
jgi:hypothetical protein